MIEYLAPQLRHDAVHTLLLLPVLRSLTVAGKRIADSLRANADTTEYGERVLRLLL